MSKWLKKKLLHDDGRTIYAAAGIYNQKLRQNNLCAEGHEKDLITAEIHKILAEREAEIANFSRMPLEKDNFS